MIFISGGNMFLVNADQQKVDRGGESEMSGGAPISMH